MTQDPGFESRMREVVSTMRSRVRADATRLTTPATAVAATAGTAACIALSIRAFDVVIAVGVGIAAVGLGLMLWASILELRMARNWPRPPYRDTERRVRLELFRAVHVAVKGLARLRRVAIATLATSVVATAVLVVGVVV
jgi:hypothetical protein